MKANVLDTLLIALSHSSAISVLLDKGSGPVVSNAGWYTLRADDGSWKITPMFGKDKKEVCIAQSALMGRLTTYASSGVPCDKPSEAVAEPRDNYIEYLPVFCQPWVVAA